MKKFLLLLIAMLFVTVPVFAQEGTIEAVSATLSINGVTASEFQMGYASVESEFKNTGSKDACVTVVIAEYAEANGVKRMNGTIAETKLVPAGKTAKIVPGLTITADTSLVKYFAYETSSLQPVEVKSFKIEAFRYLGTDEDNASVYEVNSFDEDVQPEISQTPVANLVSPAVCTWEDNKTAAVSITIDDGDYDSAVMYNQLLKTYGIHSTQFMITNKVAPNGTPDKTAVSNWQKIFDDGYMDLGNHSYSHNIKYNESNTYTAEQLEYDITDSYKTLRSLFPGEDVITFASPWGSTTSESIAEMKKNHYANRGAGGGVVGAATPSDWFKIPSVTVLITMTADNLNSYVDSAINSKGWYIPLLHTYDIDNNSTNTYTIKQDVCDNHFKYIGEKSNEGKVWAGSFNEVVKYIYERNTAKAKLLWTTEESVGIRLTDGMEDDEVFDYPLTLKANVPDSWSGSVTVTQDGNTGVSEIFTENGKKYAYIKVVPDSGNAVLTN